MAQSVTQTNALYALDGWTVTAVAAAGTPSASKAAGAAGVRHFATGVEITVACTGTAQPAVQVNLRDGATGAGTILKSWALSAPTNGSTGSMASLVIQFPTPIAGSAATAMTLEFAAATAAATIASVNLQGFDA